jgi:hypothetical protein
MCPTAFGETQHEASKKFGHGNAPYVWLTWHGFDDTLHLGCTQKGETNMFSALAREAKIVVNHE